MGHGYITNERISGNGDVVTETRDVGYFTELRITGARSTVVYGDSDGPIRLTGDSNIIENTVSYIDGDRLIITSKDGMSLNPSQRVEIEVPSTSLNFVRVSGSNRIELRDIDQEQFGIRGSGSTRVEADGSVDVLEIRMSGSSRITAPDLISKTAEVRTSGSSIAEIYVTERLESRSSGSSEIVLYGNPGRIVNQSSGSSRLRSVGQ
jgi:hypothetical protein